MAFSFFGNTFLHLQAKKYHIALWVIERSLGTKKLISMVSLLLKNFCFARPVAQHAPTALFLFRLNNYPAKQNCIF